MKTDSKTILSPFALCDRYYENVRKRIFTLLFIGYARVRKMNQDLTQADEDDITNRIVKEIEVYQKDINSPDWADSYMVEQQRPIAPSGEIGDKRKWLDIFLRGNRAEGNHEFCFESKRLYPDQKTERYFGQQGMQRFLTGLYPVNLQKEAGMLGYVQSHDIPYWLNWLRKHFADSRNDLCVPAEANWNDYSVVEELENTFQTCHKPEGENIVLFHILLSFTNAQ